MLFSFNFTISVNFVVVLCFFMYIRVHKSCCFIVFYKIASAQIEQARISIVMKLMYCALITHLNAL